MKNLNTIVKDSLNETAEIIEVKDNIILLKFEKGENIEYATFKYNDLSIYSGHYFTTKFSSENVAFVEALSDYYERRSN